MLTRRRFLAPMAGARPAPPYPDWARPGQQVLVRGPNFACAICTVRKIADPEGGVNRCMVSHPSRATPFVCYVVQGQRDDEFPRRQGHRAAPMLNEAPISTERPGLPTGRRELIDATARALPEGGG